MSRSVYKYLAVLVITLCFISYGTAVLAVKPGTPVICRVPEDYATIQSAIDAASNGDTVLVNDGIYNENIVFPVKEITVKSVNGAENENHEPITTINGGLNGAVVTFSEGVTADAVLDGFTITNGTGYSDGSFWNVGGGIYMVSASPTIRNCTVIGNSVGYLGGGIYTSSSSPYLFRCRIDSNTSMRGSNGSGGLGGGIFFDNYSAPVLYSCIISNNFAEAAAGGIYFNFSHPTDGSSWMTNCVVSGNTAGFNAGGLFFNHSSIDMTNCTIADNSAADFGGAIRCYYSILQRFTNCIIYGNTPDQIYSEVASPVLYNTDIQGGWPIGEQNIDAPPLFMGAGDYHLQPGSPCIESGTNTDAPPDDIEGVSRPQDGDGDSVAVTDMGAYEYALVVNTIDLTKVLYDYVGDMLEVGATSSHGIDAVLTLELDDSYPMSWDQKNLYWKITLPVAAPPESITVCGPLDGCKTIN